MGFLDSLIGTQKVSEEVRKSVAPLRVSINFTPFRLAAMRDGSVNLIVRITNTTKDVQLVSFEVLLPKQEMIGFDPTALNKYIEKKVGEIAPNETKEVAVTIWGTNQTKANNYPVEVTVYSHYLNYDKVINYVKKKAILRVV
jgi:uncharacterized membrane protein